MSEHETAQTVVGGPASEGSFVALVWFVGREPMRRPQVVAGAMVVGAWIVGLNLATVAQADGFGSRSRGQPPGQVNARDVASRRRHDTVDATDCHRVAWLIAGKSRIEGAK